MTKVKKLNQLVAFSQLIVNRFRTRLNSPNRIGNSLKSRESYYKWNEMVMLLW